MNEKNLEFLKDQLKYTGFCDKFNQALEESIKNEKKAFSLVAVTEFDAPGNKKEQVNYQLNFSKGKSSDLYFFNSYDAKLQKDNNEVSSRFWVNKENTVTAKEAFNLLSGRSVYKGTKDDMQDKSLWLKLDVEKKDGYGNATMKSFNKNYGFDLEGSLSKLPIKELQQEETKNKLLQSLQKGNAQIVIFEKEGVEKKTFVHAEAQFKNIAISDKDLSREFRAKGNETEVEPVKIVPAEEKSALVKIAPLTEKQIKKISDISLGLDTGSPKFSQKQLNSVPDTIDGLKVNDKSKFLENGQLHISDNLQYLLNKDLTIDRVTSIKDKDDVRSPIREEDVTFANNVKTEQKPWEGSVDINSPKAAVSR